MRRRDSEQFSEDDLLDDALDWLRVDRTRRNDAAEQIRELKTRFLKETDDHESSVTLGEIAKALQQERDTAHKLANSLTAVSRRLHYLLPMLGHDHDRTHNILADRIGLAQQIAGLAVTDDDLARKIPTTGRPNLYHLAFGKPITFVAYQCHHLFSEYRGWPDESRRDEIIEARERYRDFSCAVYAFISNGDKAPERLVSLCNEIELAFRRLRPLQARLAEIRRQERIDGGQELIAEKNRIKCEIGQIKFPKPLA